MGNLDTWLQLLDGVWTSILIFVFVFFLSIPLGLLLDYFRKFIILKQIISVFINIMRGTPLMLQLFVVFYGLSYIPIIGEYVNIKDRFFAAIITYILNYSAYFSEIFRGGFKSVPNGQFDASYMLGLTNSQTFSLVILPQVLKVTLPSIANEAITLVKDTSLVYVIGIVELLSRAKSIVNETVSIAPYIIAGLIYFLISYGLTLFFRYLEKEFEYKD